MSIFFVLLRFSFSIRQVDIKPKTPPPTHRHRQMYMNDKLVQGGETSWTDNGRYIPRRGGDLYTT